MDWWKLQEMLKRESVFFSRADLQTDNLEGQYGKEMLTELERVVGSLPSDDGTDYTISQWHTNKELPSRLISCWSVGLEESQKRWTEYTKSPDSVAIRSTIGRLKASFHEKEEPVVWIGRVRYGEKANTLPQSFHRWGVNYWLYPFFGKSEDFRWENEVRAIVNIARRRQVQFDQNPSGCYIRADLGELVESVWMHPQADAGLKDHVAADLAAHGLGDVGVYQSSWASVLE